MSFPFPRSRRLPHAALSYLLAAAFAYAAFSLGHSPKMSSAPCTLRPAAACGSDVDGEAAARFCQLLLDNAERRLINAPGVTVMPAKALTQADAEHEAVEFVSTATLVGHLQGEPRRLLYDPACTVTLTQHVAYHGAECYSFEIAPPPESGSTRVVLLFDQRTCLPLGCRYLSAANGPAADFAVTREWRTSPAVASRIESVQR